MPLVLNGTTGVSAVDGSASVPAFQGTDTNTGMFFPAADTIAFTTNGTEDMRIDPSGNVGIGQTPTAYGATVRNVEAYIAGASGYTLVSASTASVRTEIASSEGSLLGQVGTRTNHPLVLKTNDTERARITPTGQVLVGATSGDAYNPLQVQTMLGFATTGGFYSEINNNLIYASGAWRNKNQGPVSQIVMDGGASSAASIRFNLAADATSTPANTAVGIFEAMRITNAGNVGIGTSSPVNKLDVVGDMNISVGNAYASNIYFNSGWKYKTNGFAGLIKIPDASGNFIFSQFANNSSGAGAAGTELERMRIDSSGNLLVGTTSALGKVTVSGGKTVITSTDAGFGQFQIGNTTSNSEVSIGFISGVTAFGSSPSSVNGNQYIWAVGAGIYGIGGNSWGVGNLAASNFVARINWNSTSWIFSSDERLKDVEGRVENALDKVAALRPVYFTWKNDGAKQRKVGLLAQDVLKVLPEAVTVPEQEIREDGTQNYLGLGMSDLVPLLTAAIQELKAELDTVKTELAALKGTA